MGKGQRARASRAGEKEAMRAAMAKKAKQKKVATITTSIIAAVLVVCIAGGLILNGVHNAAVERGDVQRKAIIMETDHFKVDAAMMTYFVYNQYNNFINTYSEYLSSFNLDAEKPLRKQDSVMSEGKSWFDYFAEQAGNQVKESLYLAEQATAAGVSLEETDKNEIQKLIDTYKEYADSSKLSLEEFIPMMFGTGVNESDVRKCLEISTLASKYYNQYQDGLEYSDEEIEKYYTDNINTYRYVDYYTYTVEGENAEAAKASADQLAAVKSVDEFEAWVEKYETAKADETEETEEGEDEEESKVEDVLSALPGIKVGYAAEDEASEWLFKTAKVGDTKVFEADETSYSVYYMTAAPYRDESATHTLRDIVLTTSTYETKEKAKAKADEVAKLLKDEGFKAESFEKYALEYSEDSYTSQLGGLCKNYKQSDFADTNIASWAFKEGRKKGDFEVIEVANGYAICYYEANGLAAWKADCLKDKKNADYSAAYEEWSKKYTLTETAKNYKKIPDIA